MLGTLIVCSAESGAGERAGGERVAPEGNSTTGAHAHAVWSVRNAECSLCSLCVFWVPIEPVQACPVHVFHSIHSTSIAHARSLFLWLAASARASTSSSRPGTRRASSSRRASASSPRSSQTQSAARVSAITRSRYAYAYTVQYTRTFN